MVRLDTQASGMLFAGQATNQTMRRAAELTLQNGFTHFRFEQASLQQGSQMAGVYSSGSMTGLWDDQLDNVWKYPAMRPQTSGPTVRLSRHPSTGQHRASA
jgi:hypothetical protein